MSRQPGISILIALGDDAAREELVGILSISEDMEVVGAVRSGDAAVALARKIQPNILLIDYELPTQGGIATTEAITSLLPGAGVILLSEDMSPDLYRRAMGVGARDIIQLPPNPEELLRAIYQVHDLTSARRTVNNRGDEPTVGRRDGQTIAVFSPKGGVGCTTLATSVAVAIRQEAGLRVALVDGSLPFGDIGVFMDLPPSRSIMDLQVPAEQLDVDFVEQALTTHEKSGVKVLLAPTRPEMADMVTGELLRRTLGLLRDRNEYVIVDTWSALDERVLTALEVADKILLVVSLELSAIKSAKIFLEVADLLKFPPEKIMPVVTRSTANAGITVADVEAALGRPVAARIPADDRVVTRSINEGDPVVLSNRASPVAQAMTKLAARLVAENYPEVSTETAAAGPPPGRPGLFKRFARG